METENGVSQMQKQRIYLSQKKLEDWIRNGTSIQHFKTLYLKKGFKGFSQKQINIFASDMPTNYHNKLHF